MIDVSFLMGFFADLSPILSNEEIVSLLSSSPPRVVFVPLLSTKLVIVFLSESITLSLSALSLGFILKLAFSTYSFLSNSTYASSSRILDYCILELASEFGPLATV
jgi:hypothetical protein